GLCLAGRDLCRSWILGVYAPQRGLAQSEGGGVESRRVRRYAGRSSSRVGHVQFLLRLGLAGCRNGVQTGHQTKSQLTGSTAKLLILLSDHGAYR
ncbi:MAG: hypothetical protein ACYS6K_28900, partial [Planctomycetota bacterium]